VFVISFSYRSILSRAFAVYLAVLLCTAAELRAQKYLTTFGEVAQMNTIRHTQVLLHGDYNGDGLEDLAAVGSEQVSLWFQQPDSLQFRNSTFFVNKPILGAAAARCNGDRMTDIILITGDPLSVSVYLAKSGGRFSLAWQKVIPGPFEKMIVADVNNDKKDDILLFGKKELGITVLPGNGNGSFGQSIVLFPDYSFNDCLVTHLGEDGFSDIVATNWISNQLLIFSGFGKLKFSEPAVLQFSTEPVPYAAAFVDFDVNRDLVVALPEERSFQILLGDGLGGFRVGQTILSPDGITDLAVGDVNGDGSADCAVLNGQSCTVWLNDGEGSMGENVRFAAGRNPSFLQLIPHAVPAQLDAAILDTTSSQLRILYSSRCSGLIGGEWSYAVGVRPGAICIGDFNRDGWPDVAVANTGSATLSLFIGKGGGKFSGQLSFDIDLHADAVRSVSRDDSTAVFVLTDSTEEKIAVADINLRTFSHALYTIPSQGVPEVVTASVDTLTGLLRFLVLERDRNRTSLASFEQIRRNQFVEKPVPLTPPYPLLAAAVGDFNGKGDDDIAYIVYDKRRQSSDLYQVNGFSFRHPAHGVFVGTVAVGEAPVPFMWTADLNRDRHSDLMVYTGGSQNFLQVYLGHSDTTVLPAKVRDRAFMELSGRDRLKIVDANGDGTPDLLYENARRRSLQVLFGRGDGSFSTGLHLGNSDAFADFALGRISRSELPELLVTDVLRGCLKVISLQEE
jgi:hypothetical protein